ncbi:hypothetical protein CKO11_10045 [Rhodobacter sp. TJ_12]|uniref:sensor domain-containing phosphodiesterase n=1 Tax=Rhodobacter sp. TJ_12 TaxID=2029399 RepID=UPI001CBEC0A3|nr:EAL domain-containing protein [Rhodobacter sp. TJ_12]MBZ4022800.1 hypothetical protein [Rhodobacter sp. TJ_12]
MDFTPPLRGASVDGVLGIDAYGRIDYANAAAAAMFGYLEDALLGQFVETLVPPNTVDRHANLRRSVLGGNHGFSFGAGKLRLVRGRHRDGHDFPMQVTLRRNGESGRIFAFMQPVEETAALGESPALPRDATHLPGPSALRRDLTAHLTAGRARVGRVGVILAEITQLAHYRATEMSRHAEMLALACATRLRGVQGPQCRLYRAGDNRFALLVPLSGAEDSLEAPLADLSAALVDPLQLGASLLHLEAVVGHATALGDAPIEAEALLANAALALNASRENHNRPTAYTPELRSRVEHRNRVLLHLRHALEEGQFVLHYQPQVDLATGEVIALEALLRWQHPDWGLLSPAEFVDVLAASELSVPVGAWVLREACRQVAAWNRHLSRPLTIAVNIFPRQFDGAILPGLVRDALVETGLDPALLEIEITENTALSTHAGAAELLEALRALGVALVLDDFGTGYASLASLARHPVQKLKIDKSFVHGLGSCAACEAILESMRGLARALGLPTVVEGVEDELTAERMRALGFEIGQGYLWSRPLDRKACAAALGLAPDPVRAF